jgi:hypothetical protein
MTQRTTDHVQIQDWIEARGGEPSVVENTDILRVDFPDGPGDERLISVDWEDFFQIFDEKQLEFLCDDDPNSRFNKFVREGEDE